MTGLHRRPAQEEMASAMPATLARYANSKFDGSPGTSHDRLVRHWFSLMVLLGALLGLFAQEAAFAAAPAMPQHEMAASAAGMSDECAEMMGLDKPRSDTPCKGLTLDCIAKMGCALPLAVPALAASLINAHFRRAIVNEQLIPRLIGRNYGPEPDPPLALG